MSITLQELECFLKDFKFKLNFWGLYLRSDREKNFKTLTTLEYTFQDVKRVLENLVPADYADGPIPEALYKGAGMWVFGKVIKKREVYIKITMGAAGAKVFCISFHFSEHALHYPFRTLHDTT